MNRNPSALRIVVTGLIGQYPLGGVAWDYLQYVLGLLHLGHDVYYLEDTGQWPYDPDSEAVAKSPDFTVGYLSRLMERFGMRDRWAYRFPGQGQWFGLAENVRREVLASADLIINVSGTLRSPETYGTRSRLAYIDSDPVFTQVKLARGQEDFRKMVDAHDVHFTFGEVPSEHVPSTGHTWRPTRQPILLDAWSTDRRGGSSYTTVMNWTSYNDVRFEGRVYAQKDKEFMRFLELPSKVPGIKLEIALSSGKTRQAPRERLQRAGWHVIDPTACCADADDYRSFIWGSRGEWSVAKHGYVVGQSGWFSCRSACYLAAGRPVILQDTGFSQVLPCGEGLKSFTTIEQAAAGLEDLEARHAHHSRAAQEIAAAYFDSTAVLTRLVDEAMAESA